MSISDVFDWTVGALGFVVLIAVLVDFARHPVQNRKDGR